MSDVEDDWKPNGRRPQSTMARSLADALDSAFMLGDVDTLSQSIQSKQQMVTIQNKELEELEAKIREAENRLKEQEAQVSASASGPSSNGHNSPHRRPATPKAFNTEKDNNKTPLFSQTQQKSRPREGYYSNSSTSRSRANADEFGNHSNSAGDSYEGREEWDAKNRQP